MIRVACIGDSITWGFTLLNPWKQSYPAQLQELLGDGYEVRNFGYNDASARFDADTPYVKKRIYKESLAWNPDIVLLMLGTNDTKTRNWDPDIFRRDYRKIIESYSNLPSHPRVILIAPIRIHLILGKPLLGVHPETMEEGVRPAIRETAEETGLELVGPSPKDRCPDACRGDLFFDQMVTLILILITAAVSILCFVGVLNINALKFNAYGYSAVGASGAVSAVLFASIS